MGRPAGYWVLGMGYGVWDASLLDMGYGLLGMGYW